jgi:hypothetical protein
LEAIAQDPRIDELRRRMHVVENPQYSADYLDPDRRSVRGYGGWFLWVSGFVVWADPTTSRATTSLNSYSSASRLMKAKVLTITTLRAGDQRDPGALPGPHQHE